MRYDKINSDLFIKNRKNLYKHMKPNAIAVLTSNDIMPTNADGIMGFKQQNDLFYLTGIDQEETMLILYPDAPKEEWKEVLFVRETSEHIRIWEGPKLDKKESREISGIQKVQWTDSFDQTLRMMIQHAEHIYLHSNEHIKSTTKEIEIREDRLRKYLQEQYPLHSYQRLAPIMATLRCTKSEHEVAMIQKACDITKKGFDRVLAFTKPGVMEYQIEAEITHEFVRNGSRGHAYTPIIGAGINACSLHYVDNDTEVQDGDLILMDFGAEYGNYCADLTRTIPANGKFSPRQRAIYDEVLNAHKEGVKMLKPGVYLEDYEKNMASLMEAAMIRLGLFTQEEVDQQDPASPLFRKYFMHGTAHHIGLDVHDVGNRFIPIQEGMVFTCEPGIYIREEGIGVRIENDYLVTQDGPKDLMAEIPIEADDIEAAMAKAMAEA